MHKNKQASLSRITTDQGKLLRVNRSIRFWSAQAQPLVCVAKRLAILRCLETKKALLPV